MPLSSTALLTAVRAFNAAREHVAPLLRQYQNTRVVLTSDDEAEIDAAVASLRDDYLAGSDENLRDRPAG